MEKDALVKAREYESEFGGQILSKDRPLFHVSPTVGWLNDPNGFSIYKGEIHLFYQYHPYDTSWGPMHWGHLKSRDLIKWERLPAALAPSQEYDSFGCFSGSALELPDGRQMLLYTGVSQDTGKAGSPLVQTQCVAYGDGVNYEKSKANPVLTVADLPEPCSSADFRDPKMWYDAEDGRYYAVMSARTADDSGAVFLFSSEDTLNWTYVSTLDGSRNELGKMWECPDLFELEGKAVLLVSPMEMRAQQPEFPNGNHVAVLLGSYDKKEHSFARERVSAMDYGLDFYAPQTLLMPDGRRILIAWMQSWETSAFPPRDAKWFGMLTIPRELHIREGRLIQNPVRELENYRTDPAMLWGQDISGTDPVRFDGVCGRTLDMTVRIRPQEKTSCREVRINIAEDETYGTSVVWRPQEGLLIFDRTNSGFCRNIVMRREVPVQEKNGELKLRFILDRFSAEIFVNDGEQALSATLYTPQDADGISFAADGRALIDVEKYRIQ